MDLLHQYASQETEESDKSQALNFASGIQKLIALQKKQEDTAIGMTPSSTFLRRKSAAGTGA